MKTYAVLSAAALIGAGVLSSSAAEARGGGALAAGIIGGLAAGALIGAAVSDAHATSGFGYEGSYDGEPAYGYGRSPAVSYRPSRFVGGYGYGYEAPPAYARRGWARDDDGYAAISHRWQPHCDRPYIDRGW